MVTCEDFERDFPLLASGNLPAELAEENRRHAESCPLCRLMTGDTARLRDLLVRQPMQEPARGFELRLQRRIRESEDSGRQSRVPLPRWAALGAGLAAGLAIGIMVLLPSPTGKEKSLLTMPAAPAGVAALQNSREDSLDGSRRAGDSDSVAPPSYDLGNRSRMVSSGR